MRARWVAVCHTRASRNDPSSRAESSPRLPLGSADQADPAVEDLGHVDGGRSGGEGVADERAQQHRPQLVQHRSGGLGPRGVGQALVPGPEPAQHRVIDPGDGAAAGVGFGEQLRDRGQGAQVGAAVVGGVAQGEDGGAQDVVGAGPPPGGEQAGHDADGVVGDQVDVGAVQDVQRRRRCRVVGVDEHQPVQRPFGEPVEDLSDQVTFRVHREHTAAGVGVGEDHVRQQGRLSRPGLAEDVHVRAGVGDGERHRPGLPASASPSTLPRPSRRSEPGAAGRPGGRPPPPARAARCRRAGAPVRPVRSTDSRNPRQKPRRPSSCARGAQVQPVAGEPVTAGVGAER